MSDNISFGRAIERGYKKYLVTRGRASKSEFWWWILFAVIAGGVLMVLTDFISSFFLPDGYGDAVDWDSSDWEPGDDVYFKFLFGYLVVAFLGFGIPTISITIRRLHDVNLSAKIVWWFVMSILALQFLIIAGGIELSRGELSWFWAWAYCMLFLGPVLALALYNERQKDNQSDKPRKRGTWLDILPILIASAFIRMIIRELISLEIGLIILGIVTAILGLSILIMTTFDFDGNNEENKYGPAPDYTDDIKEKTVGNYVSPARSQSYPRQRTRVKPQVFIVAGCVVVIIGIVIAVMKLISSGSFDTSIGADVEYYPVMVEEDGGWNLIDSEGNLLLARDRDGYISPVINGVFVAAAGEGLAVVTAESVPKVIARDLVCAGYLGCGVIPVTRKGERISIIDKKGKRVAVLDPIDGREIAGADNMFIDGLLKVYDEDYKCAFVDTEGKVVIPFKYDYVSDFSDGYAFAYTDISDEVRSVKIIDNKGEELCTLEQGVDPTGEFSHGLVPASQNNRAGYVDTDGKFTPMPVSVQYLSNYDGECFVFYDEEGKVGLINRAGKKMVSAKYISLTPIGNGKYLARRDIDDQSSWSIINGKGEILVNIGQYEFIQRLPGKGFCLVASGEKYSKLLNSNGEQVGTTEFYILDSSLRSEEEGTPIYSEWPGVGFRYE